MGIIINLSDSDKRYASINNNTINVSKITTVETVSEDEDEYTILDYHKLVRYNISCNFNIWDNDTHYKRRDKSNVTYTLEVNAFSPTVPENVYDVLYTKFKELYPSYEDDI